MRLVPRKPVPQVSFFETHLARWALDPAAVGATPEEVAELQAVAAQQVARQAARTATQRRNQALAEMRNAGAAMIERIRSKARLNGKKVFVAAAIDAPRERSRIGPPGTAFGFRTELSAIGWLALTWRCKHPRGSVGTTYLVRRRIDETGPYTFLAAVGRRRFVDKTIPAGSASVTYEVQAMRSRAVGQATTFTVFLGVPQEFATIVPFMAAA